VPTVFEPATLDEVLAQWPAERRLALCDNSGGGAPPIADALAQASEGPWALLVGPEGGIVGSELDALRKLPFVTVIGLGPRVLRADTAALAALACWQALVGDWRRPRAC
jgi:16S rRNA (uracil1498-N3)-methyltransferase